MVIWFNIFEWDRICLHIYFTQKLSWWVIQGQGWRGQVYKFCKGQGYKNDMYMYFQSPTLPEGGV